MSKDAYSFSVKEIEIFNLLPFNVFIIQENRALFINKTFKKNFNISQKNNFYTNDEKLKTSLGKYYFVIEAEINKIFDQEVKNFSINVIIQNKSYEIIAGLYSKKNSKNVIAFIKRSNNIKVWEKDHYLYQQIFENSSEGIIVTDKNGLILTVNKAFSNITGYKKNEVMGKTPKVIKSNKHERNFYQTIWKTLDQEGYWEGEIWNRKKNGEAFLEWLSINSIVDKKNKTIHYIGFFHDITGQKKIEEDIQYLSYYDALTTLPNRFMFQDKLLKAIHNAKKNKNSKIALLYINLDRFKNINDTLGHVIGDLLLIEVSHRLQELIPKDNTLSRLSGDDFAILIPFIDDENMVLNFAQTILDDFKKPFKIKERDIFITVSIGISLYPENGEGVRTLLKNSELAMFKAKEKGWNCYQFFFSDMNIYKEEDFVLENRLRKALSNNEFILYYQPQFDARTNKIIGAEALIRWNYNNEIISPFRFIPLAEEIGSIIPIGNWVLKTACSQLKKWHQLGFQNLNISINLSPHQFKNNDIVSEIKKMLLETNLPPENITFEITESITMYHNKQILKLLSEIKQLGVNLAIDDFGTGYSSLSYLKNFPIDQLKVDKSFVLDSLTDEKLVAIIDTIITLGHNLNLKVTAEGIETIEHLNLLNKLHCDIIQGFYYGKPVPENEFFSKYLKG